MGVHSTLTITRQEAIRHMLSGIAKGLTNESLENYMDSVLDNHLYNCVVIPDWSDGPNDNDIIDSILGEDS